MKRSKKTTSLFQKFNKSFYTTGQYDDYLLRFKRLGTLYTSRIVKKLRPSPSWKFLDVGCGMGGTILALRNLGFEAWGTEVSPYCLRYSPIKRWLKFGDVRHLPFANKTFEVVLCVDVLFYLSKKEIKKAIKELTRVTKRFLYIEVISPNSPKSKQRFNPDPLRKKESLLPDEALKNLFAQNQFLFLSHLFDPEEEIDLGSPFGIIKRVDFNGFFACVPKES